MTIPIVDSRELTNTWHILDSKSGCFIDKDVTFKFPYTGSFSQGIAEWFIRVYSNPGDTIIDPFGGRGTTAMQSLWHKRNVIMNDLNPYSTNLCHSVMYPPYMKDVLNFLKILEDYVNGNKYQFPTNYAGKGSEKDAAKLYHNSTFNQIIKLRNILNNRNILLGFGDDLFGEIGQYYSKKLKDVYTYRHEMVMFTRMVMSQLMLHSNSKISFNGISARGGNDTNLQALIRHYDGKNPKCINIFENMKYYVEKTGWEYLSIRDKFNKLNRKLISCDARKLDLPNECADMVMTSPPYWGVLDYGRANWLRIWSLCGIGDPLIGKNINTENLEKHNSSEIYGKIYDKITDKTGGTLDNPLIYCSFINWYLKELYRVLKENAVAVIIVGDYGNKGKVNTWKLVIDRAESFGFKPKIIIKDKLHKQSKISSQFLGKHNGGKNDFDLCVVLYKGNYEIKNDPEQIDFRWRAAFVDDEQLSIDAIGDELYQNTSRNKI